MRRFLWETTIQAPTVRAVHICPQSASTSTSAHAASSPDILGTFVNTKITQIKPLFGTTLLQIMGHYYNSGLSSSSSSVQYTDTEKSLPTHTTVPEVFLKFPLMSYLHLDPLNALLFLFLTELLLYSFFHLSVILCLFLELSCFFMF